MVPSNIIRSHLNKSLWMNLRNLHNKKFTSLLWSSSIDVLSINNRCCYSTCNKISTNFYKFHNTSKQNFSPSLAYHSIYTYSTKPKSNYDKNLTNGNHSSSSSQSENVQYKQGQQHVQSSSSSSLKQQQQQTKQKSTQGKDEAEGSEGKSLLPDDLLQQNKKLGLFAKFKLMYKQYWYVLIPVHVITSIGWFGGFYYLSKSGVDIPSLLQTLHISESIIDKLKGSDMGHIAVAYLCYKIATPARYAVTVGGTTISIKYLVQAGYIKPMPTKEQIIKMYEDRKEKRKNEKEKEKESND